jgi:uncharacterized membrane protein
LLRHNLFNRLIASFITDKRQALNYQKWQQAVLANTRKKGESMLIDSLLDLPIVLAQSVPGASKTDIVSIPTDATTNITMVLRWFHILAGIIWIGHLYFFNLVNVSLMKSLDGPTKGKVIPQLMPRALWWFRWGAAMTVLFGLVYYIQILHDEPSTWGLFFKWLVVVLVTYVIIFFLLRQSFPPGKGWVLGVIVAVVVVIMAIAVLKLLGDTQGMTRYNELRYASNRALSIGIGGGLGLIMLFNVWGIIWPAQKRIIAWTYDNAEKGTAIPAESAALARKAFLASRMNTWLSVPMLFFMIASNHYIMFGRL